MSTDNQTPAPAENNTNASTATPAPREKPASIESIKDSYRQQLNASAESQPTVDVEETSVETNTHRKSEATADTGETKQSESPDIQSQAEEPSKDDKRVGYYRRQAEKAEKRNREVATKLLKQTKSLKQLEAKFQRQQQEYSQLSQLISQTDVDPNTLYQLGLENQLSATQQEQQLQQDLAQWEVQQKQQIQQQAQQLAREFAEADAKARAQSDIQRELQEAQEAFPNVPKEYLITAAVRDTKRHLKDIAADIWSQMVSSAESEVLQKHKQAVNPPAPMRTGGTIPAPGKGRTVADIVEHYKKFV